MTTKLQDRAALALDMTHGASALGIHTETARLYLATWLDGFLAPHGLKLVTSRAQVKRWIEYLEMIARECARRAA